ncbi:amidohydrolase family protein [Pseudonocardia halophobica]|uniref:amidohydrolase family protein n=1 Tax=Pseudonocardia halophobica TaxID=29401 RepID=UPI0022AF4DF6|nr:amidohydrolase family protein [Pseudonocardia halophobica]
MDQIQVIDADSHLHEPPDLWTARMSARKWGESSIPHVVRDDRSGNDVWVMGGLPGWPSGGGAQAGWKEWFPAHPPRFEDADRAASDPTERLRWMDEHGIYAQLLYSNVALFRSAELSNSSSMNEELLLECLRVYNDFQTEWAAAAPGRFIPLTQIPFWNLEASVAEVLRCAENGHRGVVMSQEPAAYGAPPLIDPHWDRLWAVAQELGLPVNFHILTGSSAGGDGSADLPPEDDALLVASTVGFIAGNLRTLSHLMVAGVCDRFPRLNFVTVESGIGWIPFFLESMDWQWQNNAATRGRELLPSELFKRQCYGCFWFEEGAARAAIDLVGADNFMFETDFPHPTSLSPGEATIAQSPRAHIEKFADLPEAHLRQILHGNAARIYHL